MNTQHSPFLVQNKQFVCFSLEERLFAIDIFMTREIIQVSSMSEIRRLPNSPRYLEGILDLRGELIPILNAREILPVDYVDLNPRKEILIISKEGQKEAKKDKAGIILGLLVDKTENIVDLDLSDMQGVESLFKSCLYVSGTLKMQDGREVYLLDPQKIFLELKEQLWQKKEEEKLMVLFKKPKVLSLEEESSIMDFLDSVEIPANSVIQKGVFRYFSQKRSDRGISLEELISEEKQKYESDSDSIFRDTKPSRFFCSEDYFSVLTHVLQNWVIPKAKEKKKLEILNLSCGEGFDLYSVLFLIKTQLKDFENWDIRVVGTSENQVQLSFAKEAFYRMDDHNIHPDLFSKIQSIYLEDFFDQTDHGYKILAEIRKNAEFQWIKKEMIHFFTNLDFVFTSSLFLAKLEEGTLKDFILGLNHALKLGAVALFREIENPLGIPGTRLQNQEYRGYPYYLMT